MTSIAARAPVSRATLAVVTALALVTLPRLASGAPSSAPASDEVGAPSPEADDTPTTAPEGSGPAASPSDADVAPDPAPETDPDPAPDPSPDPAPDPPADPQADPEDADVVDTGTLDDRDPAAQPDAPDPVQDEAAPAADDAAAADEVPELPELSTLQTAGWWTLFGAFAVGTTAGVFAGLAERQEDRALRLATLFDSETGMQPIYEDHREDYETHLRRGVAFERTAIGLGAVAGAVLVTGIVLFAIDASRRRAGDRDTRRARVRPGLGGWEVQF